MKELKGQFVKVTTTELYFFDERYCNGWPIEKVIDEWFLKYPIDACHAARDGSHVGYSKRLVSIEQISEDEAAEYSLIPNTGIQRKLPI